MRFVFTADKILLEQLKVLQEANGTKVSQSEVMVDAVQMLYQIDTLLSRGYRFALISPDGKTHYIRKQEEDEDGQDIPSDSEDS